MPITHTNYISTLIGQIDRRRSEVRTQLYQESRYSGYYVYVLIKQYLDACCSDLKASLDLLTNCCDRKQIDIVYNYLSYQFDLINPEGEIKSINHGLGDSAIQEYEAMRQSISESNPVINTDDQIEQPQSLHLKLIDHLDGALRHYRDFQVLMSNISQYGDYLNRKSDSYLDGLMIFFDERRAISRPVIALVVSLLSAFVAYVSPVAVIAGLFLSLCVSAVVFALGRMTVLILTARQLNVPVHHLMPTALSSVGESYEVVAVVAPLAVYLLAPMILPSQYAAAALIYVRNVAMRAAYSCAASCIRVIQYLRECVFPVIGERKRHVDECRDQYRTGKLPLLDGDYCNPVLAKRISKCPLSVSSGQLTEHDRVIWNIIEKFGSDKLSLDDLEQLRTYCGESSISNVHLKKASQQILAARCEETVGHHAARNFFNSQLDRISKVLEWNGPCDTIKTHMF